MPLMVILGETATAESLAAMEEKLGLNQPALQRYGVWVGGWLQGKTAVSIAYDTPTAQLMLERLQVTLPLAVMAMGLTVALALTLGVFAASKQNKAGDMGVMTLSQLGLALPNFWLAILLILLFAVHLEWVSAGAFRAGLKKMAAAFGRAYRRCSCLLWRWRPFKRPS